MRGFDRPLQPEWVFKIIKIAKINEKLIDQKHDMELCIPELQGDGNRKVRTIINRYFLVDDLKDKKIVSDSMILGLLKSLEYFDSKNAMLFIMLIQEPILKYYSELFEKYFTDVEKFNAAFLKKLAIEKMGERDIAGRTLRNFLATLVSFDVLKQEGNDYSWNNKISFDDDTLAKLLVIYAQYGLHSPQVDLDHFDNPIFFYFDLPDFDLIAKKYSGEYWDYIKQANKSYLLLHREYVR